ncbi:MAG: hypothetical protein AB1813_16375 [Verrucomicrobiota bacterium]
MDPWLTDEVKELLFSPCLLVSGMIAQKLDNRARMGQEMDERALTELLVDALDARSAENTWGNIQGILRDHRIYLDTRVSKATQEHIVGADIGITISRQTSTNDMTCKAEYGALIQCKKIDSQGRVADFFHEVRGSKRKQSSLMLELTPAAFYFIFTPPSLLNTYCSIEPIAFAASRPGCSSAVWNSGSFAFGHKSLSFLSSREKAQAVGVLVVPALAVEAQQTKGRGAALPDILPNCLPLWYWFGELLIPGFIGDSRAQLLSVARNSRGPDASLNVPGVRYSLDVSLGNG